MRRHPLRPDAMRRAALTLATACLVPALAQAQIFTAAPASPSAFPAPLPIKPTVEPVRPATLLRYLPSTIEGLKLSGEIGDLRWPVYVTAAQAAASTRFRIGYVSAVSILPEASTLEIRVNDSVVGTQPIDAAQGLRTFDVAIPAGLLKAGYNAVSLSVQQRHRVDCSVAATYELWTKIDPAETGLVLAGDVATVASLSDMAALLPRADGTLPIHIVMAGKTNPVHLRHLVKATQVIALAARAQQPSVDFGSSVVDAYGVNLALGTREVLGHIPQLAGLLGASGPLATIVPASAIGRPTILITGSTEAEIETAIASIADSTPPVGTTAGLAAAARYPGTPTSGNERLHLADLGIKSRDFSGRFFRKSFNLVLPADFLASDYDRGTFDLAGGYAAGLTRDAQVRVDVDGRSAGVIKLPYASGDVFRHNQLFLPLSLMRPGLNRVDIFAETPRPEDADCSASAAKRFLLLDASDVVLPPFAHVQRLPDLAVTTSGALPYTRGKARLVVPKPDRETMAAALSLTARAAIAAGAPVAFDFSTTMPDDDAGSTLVVSPARLLDPAILTDAGLDPAAIEAAWHDVVPPPKGNPGQGAPARWWLSNTDGPSACRLPAQAVSLGKTAPVPAVAAAPEPMAPVAVRLDATAPPENDDLLERWTPAARPTHRLRDAVAAVSAHVSDVAGRTLGLLHWPAAKSAGDGLTPNASLLLAQSVSSGSHGNVTTIVTAPDSATLQASVACLLDPQVWSKVHGRLAVLDASSGAVTATDATSFQYVASGSGSLANSRLVMAGWFSLNPFAFVMLALLTALCLSGTTLWFVRGVGRRPE